MGGGTSTTVVIPYKVETPEVSAPPTVIPPTVVTLEIYNDVDKVDKIGETMVFDFIPNATDVTDKVRYALGHVITSQNLYMTMYTDHGTTQFVNGDRIIVVPRRCYYIHNVKITLAINGLYKDLFKAVNDKFDIICHKITYRYYKNVKDIYSYMGDETIPRDVEEFVIQEFDFEPIPIINNTINVKTDGDPFIVKLDQIVGDVVSSDGRVVIHLTNGQSVCVPRKCRSTIVADRQAIIINDHIKKHLNEVECLGKQLLLLYELGLPYDVGMEIAKLCHERRGNIGPKGDKGEKGERGKTGQMGPMGRPGRQGN